MMKTIRAAEQSIEDLIIDGIRPPIRGIAKIVKFDGKPPIRASGLLASRYAARLAIEDYKALFRIAYRARESLMW